MPRVLLTLSLLILSLNSFAASFSAMAGNYKITGCVGTTSSTLNYCAYDQVVISNNAAITNFEFFAQGTSVLKFGIQADQSTHDLYSESTSSKASLASTQDGISSEISIQSAAELPSIKVLKLSSESLPEQSEEQKTGNAANYQFELILESI